MPLKFASIALVSILFSLNAFSQVNSTKILNGKWEATDRGKTGKFEFLDYSHLIISYPDGSIDNCTYQIDFKKDPVWFDIKSEKSGLSRPLNGLIQIINDSTFNWCLSRDGKRPLGYSHPSMTFRKKN